MNIIIIICILVLISYIFDLSSKKTKIPTIVLLLILGWIVKQFTTFLNIELPDLHSLLPIIGTVGLILIVLEGALELELNKSKKKNINKNNIFCNYSDNNTYDNIWLWFSFPYRKTTNGDITKCYTNLYNKQCRSHSKCTTLKC